MGAKDDIVLIHSHLAMTPDVVFSFGLKLGRHAGIGRNRDGGGASLNKQFRINHFASVSDPRNALCLTWGAPIRGPKTKLTDTELPGKIQADLERSPFQGEGHRKVWARLRVVDEVRVSRKHSSPHGRKSP